MVSTNDLSCLTIVKNRRSPKAMNEITRSRVIKTYEKGAKKRVSSPRKRVVKKRTTRRATTVDVLQSLLEEFKRARKSEESFRRTMTREVGEIGISLAEISHHLGDLVAIRREKTREPSPEYESEKETESNSTRVITISDDDEEDEAYHEYVRNEEDERTIERDEEFRRRLTWEQEKRMYSYDPEGWVLEKIKSAEEVFYEFNPREEEEPEEEEEDPEELWSPERINGLELGIRSLNHPD